MYPSFYQFKPCWHHLTHFWLPLKICWHELALSWNHVTPSWHWFTPSWNYMTTYWHSWTPYIFFTLQSWQSSSFLIFFNCPHSLKLCNQSATFLIVYISLYEGFPALSTLVRKICEKTVTQPFHFEHLSTQVPLRICNNICTFGLGLGSYRPVCLKKVKQSEVFSFSPIWNMNF